MGMTPRELESRLTGPELMDYLRLYRMEPWGEERMDLRFAIQDCLIASMFAGKGRKPKVEDFMPKFGRPPRQTPAEHLAIFTAFMRSRGHG